MSKQVSPPPPGDKPTPGKPPPPPPRWRHSLLPIAAAVAFFLWIFLTPLHSGSQTTLSYTQFQSDVSAHKVKTANIPQGTGSATGTLTNGSSYTVVLPTPASSDLTNQLTADGVNTTFTAPSSGFGSELLSWLILLAPLLLFGWFYVRLSRGAGGGGGAMQGLLGVGRSKAKVFDEERPSTKFTDVAGYEGAKSEISEVVDFLRTPERYARAGAVVPRGVLMVGPPGTGKTLLARAVAGEAHVPFFSVTGSSFVEMFVGVGASRVRDLFADARKRAPSIIFIDEIDAIGGKRNSGHGFGSNDEREQTLNQMLAEMDGFDPATGVVVIAATNRPESLDPALLRPGRFDRTVEIPLPNQAERRAILAVHATGKRLTPDVDLDIAARGTPGFSGADLANLINEAAIVAVRHDRDVITARDIDEARDRIILGRRDGSNALLPEEKHAVAVHESGHALVALLSEHADPVAKVTILPSGRALGVTEQLPVDERHLYAESYLHDSLAIRLGGRAAEVLVLGEGSTGAANDLAGATDLALKMVREWGLSARLGPIGYGPDGPQYLGGQALGQGRPYAEGTQRAIDEEVSRLLLEAEERATTLLTENRAALEAVVGVLLEKETITGQELTDTVRAARASKAEVAPRPA